MPRDVALQLADRVKKRRLEMNLTQEGLALRAGLKLPTYRRFERTGDISLKGLLYIAFAINALSDFDWVFDHRQYQTIKEVLDDKEITRKRGKKNE